MICNGKTPAADYIEIWNQYCKINQAWIEVYLAMAKFYIPQNKETK